MIDKFGWYLQLFKNVIADTAKERDRAILEGKWRIISDAGALSRSALFLYNLDPAKKFS